MIDVEFTREIYEKAASNDLIKNLNLVAQSAVGIVIMVTLLAKILTKRVGTHEQDALKPSDFVRPVLLMGLVFTYTYFLDFLDFITVGLEKFIHSNTPSDTGYDKIVFGDFANAKEATEDLGVFDSIAYYLKLIYNKLTHPGIWIMEDFRLIFYGIDKIIYGVALLSRAFKLYLLRLTGSFAILASMYHRYEGFTANWVKWYVLNYVWVALLFAINYFCEIAFWSIKEVKLQGGADSYGFISTLSYIAILFVKIKLYKRSFDWLKGLFSNG
ncbi:MAG: hypothetical protein GXX85_00835 [Ignavibacteria bacterium]|nr:hypothetical protein [Ignavibacteria bacterium]